MSLADHIVGPWVMLASTASYIPGTILNLVRGGHWRSVFSWSHFQEAWFGRFWADFGPTVRQRGETFVVPLLKGRVSHGRKLEEGEELETAPLPVSGTIIEVGAGSGMWVSLFKEIGISRPVSDGNGDYDLRQRKKDADIASTSGGITKIYGVEPNPKSQAALRQRVHDEEMDDVYEVVPLGIQDVASAGIPKVDCVVAILCLCSIPSQPENIKALYEYLKPGGRMYVYEHVCNNQHWSVFLYQKLLNFFWPRMVGGCELQRNTGRILRDAAPWTHVDLAPMAGEPWYHTLPHVVGVLTK